MCTLSFAPIKDGYVLAMNRDERISREAALAPEITQLHGVQSIFPRERSGGTWIGVNEHGLCLALLNKNRDSGGDPNDAKRSRGEIIPALLHLSSLSAVEHHLRALPLNIFKPFRLIGISPEERATREWSWDAVQLLSTNHEWSVRGWFSSSASDELAEKYRGRVFRQFASRNHSPEELRNLHASHDNGPGAFSVCVHRSQVKTVSYSEILCDWKSISVAYRPGAPCDRRTSYSGNLLHLQCNRGHVSGLIAGT